MVPIEGAVNHSDMEPEDQSLRERFNRIADATTVALGSLPALVGSVLIVIVWALTGPLFNFSDTWQLFINTTTTVVTFWMVFVIQSSANRSSKATQLKLDEIIRVLGGARNVFITLDHAPEDVLVEHEKELVDLANDHPETNVLPGEPQPAGKTTSS
jgi:low affinity Fe/Cu permease